jgi:hypothetical protein
MQLADHTQRCADAVADVAAAAAAGKEISNRLLADFPYLTIRALDCDVFSSYRRQAAARVIGRWADGNRLMRRTGSRE